MIDGLHTEFDVNDSLVDTVAAWLSDLWSNVLNGATGLPVTIVSEEGMYGTLTPIRLRG